MHELLRHDAPMPVAASYSSDSLSLAIAWVVMPPLSYSRVAIEDEAVFIELTG